MNFKSLKPLKWYVLLAIVFVFLCSCERNGLARALKTSNSIQDVDNEMRRMATQIEVTNTSLETLVDADTPDLKNDFDTYSVNLKKLNQLGKIVQKRIDEMKSNGNDYFVEWKKQEDTYTNQTVRNLSERRRTKLSKSYDDVRIKSMGISETYLAYSNNLNDVQSYLNNDLTISSINALKPVIQKSKQNLKELNNSFDPVIVALNDIRSQLYGGTN